MSLKPHQPPRKSTRLRGYDYAQEGAYFVTLCTQNRISLFGAIEGDEMQPNDSGNVILYWWNELQTKFPSIELDSHILMPNHFHAIIVLFDVNQKGAPTCAPLQNNLLDQIIQWFKTMTTNAYIRGVKEQDWQVFPGKLWQRSYHDHIIRNEDDLNTRRQYILSNPAKWDLDDENPASTT
jgi:putative transposase